MKKIIFLLLTIFLLTSPNLVKAISVAQPFGGMVSMYPQPGVACPTGYGAFFVNPVGISAPGPFLLPFINNSIVGFNGISVGKWILGTYLPVPLMGGCVTTTTPPVPIPTLQIYKAQTSPGIGL